MPALYQRIKNYITDRIESGEFKPGAKVPSENELLRRMSASRMTVNRALRELTEEGVLYRVAGVGTFVAQARLQHPSAVVKEIRHEIERNNNAYRPRVIQVEQVLPPPAMAEAMGMGADSSAFHSRILHCADDQPVMLEDRWVNPAIAPGYLEVDFEHTTPTRHLLANAPLQRVEQRMRAVQVDTQGAELLQISTTDPVLLLTRRTWTRNQVASVVNLYYVGSRYELNQGADDLPDLPVEFLSQGEPEQ